jgi:sugar phosphate isomerase/epimerase
LFLPDVDGVDACVFPAQAISRFALMPRYSLGVAATSYLSVWETLDTLEFLERCHGFGAAGIHAVVRGEPALIRARAEKYEMYFEGMVPLPSGDDTGEFEESLRRAKAAGATALRAACLGTRRYETFPTLEAWRAHVAVSQRSLAAAIPLLDRYKIPLGLENHKDWSADELVALMGQYSSEYFGVCLDFGNNISLLDDPMAAIKKLAPYTVTTHLKDIAVAPYEEGILLSEVILGHGLLDLRQAVEWIRRARPDTRMNLEMITREPLKIPMLSESYWATLPEKTALDLARTLRFVHEKSQAMVISKTEDRNVIDCLAAWEQLGV